MQFQLKRFLVLLAAAILLCQRAEAVVGGNSTDANDHAYMVQVFKGKTWVCGGTMITQKHVLTAAHCTSNTTAGAMYIKTGASIFGLTKTVPVFSYACHPDYNSTTYDNDVAVLKLLVPVPAMFMSTLPLCNTALQTKKGVLYGWGRTSEGGAATTTLRAVQLPVVADSLCTTAYSKRKTKSMFCAGKPNHGMCGGDDGGALVVNGQACGIASYSRGCGRKGFPTLFTNVNVVKTFVVNRMR